MTDYRARVAEALAATNMLDGIDLEYTLDLVLAVPNPEVEELRRKIAAIDQLDKVAIGDWERANRDLKTEVEELRRIVAHYEEAISWETTCLEHSRLLTECRRQEERAERAEAAIARVRADCEAQKAAHGAHASLDSSRGGIWAQAARTRNILDRHLKEQT